MGGAVFRAQPPGVRRPHQQQDRGHLHVVLEQPDHAAQQRQERPQLGQAQHQHQRGDDPGRRHPGDPQAQPAQRRLHHRRHHDAQRHRADRQARQADRRHLAMA